MIHMYILLAVLAAFYDVGSTFVIISIFALLLFNLGKREEGTLSAWSVFNPDFQNLPGTTTAEMIDNNIRNNMG